MENVYTNSLQISNPSQLVLRSKYESDYSDTISLTKKKPTISSSPKKSQKKVSVEQTDKKGNSWAWVIF